MGFVFIHYSEVLPTTKKGSPILQLSRLLFAPKGVIQTIPYCKWKAAMQNLSNVENDVEITQPLPGSAAPAAQRLTSPGTCVAPAARTLRCLGPSAVLEYHHTILKICMVFLTAVFGREMAEE
jgi:hypothetical protein